MIENNIGLLRTVQFLSTEGGWVVESCKNAVGDLSDASKEISDPIELSLLRCRREKDFNSLSLKG